jgi:nucleotide-binding universal stress UspA family protein
VAVMIWINPGAAWECAVDAGSLLADGDVVLLLVTSAGDEQVARGAFAGLLGRGGLDPGDAFEGVQEDQAATLFDEAEARLGRPARRLWLRGRVEREVVAAANDADLLIVARDGDLRRLGPRSLGPAGRFVVDHAPCQVLLVWPGPPPSLGSIPPRPHP